MELLDGLKKDDVSGDFFIYLMQELTNIISDFSDDMDITNFGGTVSATLMLIFFHINFISDVLILVVSKFGKIGNLRRDQEYCYLFFHAPSAYCSLVSENSGSKEVKLSIALTINMNK